MSGSELSGQESGSDTWMSYALDAWEVSAEGPADEIALCSDFEIQIFRPDEIPELDWRDSVSDDVQAGEITPSALVKPLTREPSVQPVAVTTLARGFLDQTVLPQVGPAVYAQREHVPATVVGEVVHHALEDWGCLALPSDERMVWLMEDAMRMGIGSVEEIVSRAEEILARFTAHPLSQEIEAAQKCYPELPFTWAGPERMVRGYVDLLYQDASGAWHVIDWKTGEYCESKLDEYRAQVAIYADAAEAFLGVRPRAAVCFLEPEIRLI